MTKNPDRIAAVADAFAAVGHDGIAAFDETEPEYDTLELLYDRFGNEAYVKLLGICAATQDYQLNGDAQQFWRELDRTVTSYETLDSIQTVRDILGDFMEASVNARLNQQKRDRLVRMFEAASTSGSSRTTKRPPRWKSGRNSPLRWTPR